VTRADPKRSFLRALARELRWRPLARRRLLIELAQHLDDSAAELQASGLSPDAALREAIRRLGDVEAIASSFRSAIARGRWDRTVGRLRSPAWVAVGAMSLVTAWAAELPPASGAKATTTPAHVHRVPRHSGKEPNKRAPSALPAERYH
jgi:hypothetical protein